MKREKEKGERKKNKPIETVPLHFKSFIKRGEPFIDFRINAMKRMLDKYDVDFSKTVRAESRKKERNDVFRRRKFTVCEATRGSSRQYHKGDSIHNENAMDTENYGVLLSRVANYHK